MKRENAIGYRQIVAGEGSELEKVTAAFDFLTAQFVSHSEREIELLQALNDQDSLIKERIKLGVMRNARNMFADTYRDVTGRKAWDESK